jgi:hypothetical protein
VLAVLIVFAAAMAGVLVAAARPTGALSGAGAALVIHHTGHDGEHERGSTALLGAGLGDSIATVQTTYLHEFDAERREAAQRDHLAALGSVMAAPGGTTRAIRPAAGASNAPL